MEQKKKFVINAAFYAVILLIFLAVYKYILPILTPFIIGFCVAFLIRLPLKLIHLRNDRYRRILAILFCLLFYILVVGALILFGAGIVTEIGNFASSLPGLFQDYLYPFFVQLAHRIESFLEPIDASLSDWIIDLGKNIAQNLGQFLTNLSASIVKTIASGAVSIPNIIIQIVLTIVSSFYIALDYDKVIAFLPKLIPTAKRSLLLQAVQYAKSAVWVYIKSYSLLFTVTFLELWLGLSILQIPYSLGIAFGIAVFDLMPVLGTGGILLPWAAVLLILGNFPLAIGITLLYIVITAVRNALEPRIVGSQIGLHPLATLVAMILGLKLFGLLGMLLFPISLVAYKNMKAGTTVQPDPDSSAE